MRTLARVFPASNRVSDADKPTDQSRLGAAKSVDSVLLSQPAPGTKGIKLSVGKYAARATPMRALAAAMARSAEATSGRRCSKSEGRPTGSCGIAVADSAGSRWKFGAG